MLTFPSSQQLEKIIMKQPTIFNIPQYIHVFRMSIFEIKKNEIINIG